MGQRRVLGTSSKHPNRRSGNVMRSWAKMVAISLLSLKIKNCTIWLPKRCASLRIIQGIHLIKRYSNRIVNMKRKLISSRLCTVGMCFKNSVIFMPMPTKPPALVLVGQRRCGVNLGITQDLLQRLYLLWVVLLSRTRPQKILCLKYQRAGMKKSKRKDLVGSRDLCGRNTFRSVHGSMLHVDIVILCMHTVLVTHGDARSFHPSGTRLDISTHNGEQ